MTRKGLLPAALALALGLSVSLVGCSKDNTTTASSTTVAAGATTTKPASAGSTPSSASGDSTPATANAIDVVVSDTKGLNGPMTMVVKPTTAKAGKVTFTVKNTGTITHEMVVLQLTGSETWDKLPVTGDKVSEDASKGETGDVGAGETKTIELNLDAGSYALVCNVEKHYAMGMRASLTVS